MLKRRVGSNQSAICGRCHRFGAPLWRHFTIDAAQNISRFAHLLDSAEAYQFALSLSCLMLHFNSGSDGCIKVGKPVWFALVSAPARKIVEQPTCDAVSIDEAPGARRVIFIEIVSCRPAFERHIVGIRKFFAL